MDITEKKIKEAIQGQQEAIANSLSITEDELGILDANLEFIGRYAHISQPGVEIEIDGEDLLKATSQALLFLYICDQINLKPASLLGKVIMDTLKYQSDLRESANNEEEASPSGAFQPPHQEDTTP